MDSKIILDPIGEALGQVRSDFLGIYKKMVILELIAMLVVVIACVIALVPFFLGVVSFNSILTNWMAVIGIILFAIVVMVIGGFSSVIVESITYNVAEDIFNKKQTNMTEKFSENAWPVIKYNIVMFAISFVVMLPFFVIYIVLVFGSYGTVGSTNILSSLLEIIFRGVMAIIGAVLHLFLQFAIFEILIGKNSVITSFKKSYDIVRRNLVETFIFSLLMWGISTAIKIPLIIIAVIVGVIFVIIGVLLASVLNGIILAVAISILVIVGLVFLIAMTAVIDTVMIPCQYKYWKRISRG